MQEEERQARWRAVQKANQHPLNQAAAKALEKVPGYDSPISAQLHMVDLLIWAFEELSLAKHKQTPTKLALLDDLRDLVLYLSKSRTQKGPMNVLTHTADGEEIDLVSEAQNPTDPMSLAWAAIDHLKMYLDRE